MLGNPRVHPVPLGHVPAADAARPTQLAGRGAEARRSSRSSPATRSSSMTPLVATYSIAACDLDAGPVGRRDPVEVPRRRLGRARGPSRGSGAIATQAYANPRYGPDGLRLLREGLGARRGRRAPDRGRRRPRPPPARGRRRERRQRHLHRRASAWTGPAASRARASRRRGTSSSRRRPSTRSPTTFSLDRGQPARRAAARLPRRRAGRGRRPPRPAVRRAPRRRARRRLRGPVGLARRPARRRPPGSGRRARPPLPPARRAVRQDAARGLARGRRRPRRPSCASVSPGSATRASSARRSPTWAGTENLEERVDGIDRIDPVVLEELRAAGDRLGGRPRRRPRRDPGRDGLVWHPVRRRLGIRAFGINAYTGEAVGKHVVEEHDETGGGAGGHEELYVVVRGRATFTVDGETLDAPAGTLVFIRDPTLKRSAIAEEEGTLVLAVGGEPGAPTRSRRGSAYFAAMPLLDSGALGRGDRAARGGPARASRQPVAPLQPRLRRVARGPQGDALTHLQEAVGARRNATPTAPRVDPDFDAIRARARLPCLAVRPAAARRAASPRKAGTGSAADRATSSTAPKPSSGVSASTSSWSPTASANALCACSPPNGARSSSVALAGEHVAVGQVPHRDVGDDRRAVGGRNRDRERVRAGQLRAAVGMAEPRAARSRSARRRARRRRAAASSGRASRSGTSRPATTSARVRAAGRRAAPRRPRPARGSRARRCRPSARSPAPRRRAAAARRAAAPARSRATRSAGRRGRRGRRLGGEEVRGEHLDRRRRRSRAPRAAPRRLVRRQAAASA